MKKEIKNLKKAAQRILKAVKNKEKIIVYGDSDMDGVSSVIILKETLATAGAKNLIIYFPDREAEGYGLNDKSLDFLKDLAPALLITLDFGIGNVKEVKRASKMGFEVIIVDHHEPLDEIPDASIVVDLKQKGDTYPFKDFANVGLTFRLSECILGKKMSDSLKKSFLELVAMATIADMVPREGENEDMIIEGMSSLENSWRPGIKVLFGLEEFKDLTLSEKIIRVNSLLNIRNVENDLPGSYRILVEYDDKKVKELARELFKKAIEKRIRIREITKEVEERISKKTQSAIDKEKIIFEGSDDWELILLGIVAGIISNKLKKPAFLYSKYQNESQGSVRAPDGFNTVEAMKSCKKLLLTYGGHAKASGFKIKNENLDEFKECLIKYFNKNKN